MITCTVYGTWISPCLANQQTLGSSLDRPCNWTNHDEISQEYWWFDKGELNDSICERFMGFYSAQLWWSRAINAWNYSNSALKHWATCRTWFIPLQYSTDSWFQQFDPFNIKDVSLRSLSSGLAAKPSHQVNCNDAESLGRKIQEQIDVAVTEVKVPRSQKVRNMLQLTKAVKISTQDVYIDPAVLFIRLLVLLERS